MQNSFGGQSGVASSYVALDSAAQSFTNDLYQDYPWGQHPTVLDLEQEESPRRLVPDGSTPVELEVTSDVDYMELEIVKGGSAPMAINNRKRTYTSSTGLTPDSGSLGTSSHFNSYMERKYDLEQPGVMTSPKQHRAGALTWPANENSSDGLCSMDDQPSSPAIQTSSPPKNAERRGDKAGKENITPSDQVIIHACLQTGIQLLNDPGLSKMGGMCIDWAKPPAKKVRPSYNCEGSRGAIKTEDGTPVELDVTLKSESADSYAAVVIAACISDMKGQKVTGHPHFKTNCVADQPYMETSIDGVSAICIKKIISGTQTRLKMDVGIKRCGERTSKLNRKCRVIYRLCLLRRRDTADGIEWVPAHWAQIVTDTISCEQSQGPPAITHFSSTKSPVDGRLVVAVKGKNLESKADDEPNVMVKFSHKDSNWSGCATVYHNVTTQYSLAFQVPVFTPWRELARRHPNIASFPVTVEISVDDRASDNLLEFHFTLHKQHRAALTPRQVREPCDPAIPCDPARYDSLRYEDVESVLRDVEIPGNGLRSMMGDASATQMTSDIIGSMGFQQQATSFPSNHREYKMEPGLNGCMMSQQQDSSWLTSQEHVMELLHIDDTASSSAAFPTS